jgi:NAD(P)-dependent dehydrogenase (short-subunit alcohol dehydrogenase family)
MAEVAKTVLVTGASSGIGKATALRLARAGWKVVATGRRPEALTELAEAGCATARLDLSSDRVVEEGCAAIVAEHGPIGVLINNAGYSQSGALETLPMAKVRAQFETNVFAPLRLAQLVLPAMRAQRWGKIVNISSMGGKLTFPGGGAYHGSKHALEALSDVLRFEVAGFGIDVVIVEPGLVRTDFGDAAAATIAGPAGDDAYAAFDAEVARVTRESYTKGMTAALTGSADDVARMIEKAITARRPRPRYRVTPAAHLLITQRRLFGDRLWDAFLRTVYPQPGR